MFPGKVGCLEVITYPFLLAPGGGFFKQLALSSGLESFVDILNEDLGGTLASGLVGTKGFGERLLLSKVDFSKDVVEFETDFSVETLVLDSVIKEDGEAETVFVAVEDVVELDDDFEVELFTNFDDVVVDPVKEGFGEGELLLGEECWGLFVNFGPDGLFGAGLVWPLVGGLGEEAVGLFVFGRDITDAGFGGINLEFTDDGFGDTDNGLGDIDFVDNGDVKCFVEAGLEDACFGEVGEADLVELDACFVFAPLASFSSTPMCLTKLGVTGFRPVLLRVVRYGRFSEPFRPRITGFGLS